MWAALDRLGLYNSFASNSKYRKAYITYTYLKITTQKMWQRKNMKTENIKTEKQYEQVKVGKVYDLGGNGKWMDIWELREVE